jgi:Flp pilus assembly protein TadG
MAAMEAAMKGFRAFAKDSSGATAIFFGLSILPVMGFAGSAIDYGRSIAARTEMQKAVDATALALVRDSANLNEGQLKKRGEDLVRSFLKQVPNLATDEVTVRRDAKTIRVAAAGTVQTAFMAIAGFGQIAIHSEAESAWGAKKIELALVLDNTGSMAQQNKMTELKKATNDLLDRLKRSAADDAAIKVSIVPFDTNVRLDAGTYRNASWLRFDHPTDRPNWKGYVADRDQPYDTGALAASAAASLYPASTRSDTDLARVLPLTSVRTGYDALKGRVAEMQPKGCTNITIGASWGLATLSSQDPMPGASSSANVEKIMVVLTDGDNTQNRFVGTPGCSGRESASLIDERSEAACASVKAAGVKLYTVRVIEGNAKLLRSCASLDEKGQPLYSEVKDASEISAVFQKIVADILSTRLTI